jgi:hypothetical protein
MDLDFAQGFVSVDRPAPSTLIVYKCDLRKDTAEALSHNNWHNYGLQEQGTPATLSPGDHEKYSSSSNNNNNNNKSSSLGTLVQRHAQSLTRLTLVHVRLEDDHLFEEQQEPAALLVRSMALAIHLNHVSLAACRGVTVGGVGLLLKSLVQCGSLNLEGCGLFNNNHCCGGGGSSLEQQHSLEHCNSQDEDGLWDSLEHHPSLRELNLSGCGITDPVAEQIFRALQDNHVLETLQLYNNEFGAAASVG